MKQRRLSPNDGGNGITEGVIWKQLLLFFFCALCRYSILLIGQQTLAGAETIFIFLKHITCKTCRREFIKHCFSCFGTETAAHTIVI